MPDVPRHKSKHERLAAHPLVTDEGRVTLVEPLDRSRNGEVRSAVKREVAAAGVDCRFADFRSGSDVDWTGLYEALRAEGASRRRIGAVRDLADRFERPYPSLLRLRVDPDTELDFEPGQYVTLRSGDTPRAYSLANAPAEHELEFCIRRVPGGRLTSELFVHVEEGDEVVVRGPYGEMALSNPSGRDVVFLATGTGVAPFRSMIEHLFATGQDTYRGTKRDVWLFLGCAWRDDLPYREWFESLAEDHERFHFVPTLTREPLLSDWSGEVDYVQQVFAKYLDGAAVDRSSVPQSMQRYVEAEPVGTQARLDPDDLDLYACGINAMVETLVRTARSVGVPEAHMDYEGFG
ncbi:FAD-binding oxidoreductase [Halomicrobium sp. LC1Hm]|uniref:FAD-binding oxidoreductase n=1 Tax=Halomicrobium sp. LC1Hm TaxID=2610902 RepID=UPI00129833D2|nr:FAD-binding oxidoreductase [Halomicrobium sp. LC1Hm]QGA83112.1 Oxidoreductase FAD/NAD(P)-binding domain protein [Halomicrobium sp. LC1Hm]